MASVPFAGFVVERVARRRVRDWVMFGVRGVVGIGVLAFWLLWLAAGFVLAWWLASWWGGLIYVALAAIDWQVRFGWL